MNDDEREPRGTVSPDAPEPEPAPVAQSPAATSEAPAPVPLLAPPVALLRRRARPVLGPSLCVFGVLLWSYLVFGQYTTTWFPSSAPMGEGAAVLGVFACTVAAWVFAVRRSLVVPVSGQPALVARAVNVGVLGFAWWFLSVVVASFVGLASGKNLDALLTPLLLIVAGAAFVQGRRMTSPAPQPATQRERALAVFLWIGAAGATLTACLELAANG